MVKKTRLVKPLGGGALLIALVASGCGREDDAQSMLSSQTDVTGFTEHLSILRSQEAAEIERDQSDPNEFEPFSQLRAFDAVRDQAKVQNQFVANDGVIVVLGGFNTCGKGPLDSALFHSAAFTLK